MTGPGSPAVSPLGSPFGDRYPYILPQKVTSELRVTDFWTPGDGLDIGVTAARAQARGLAFYPRGFTLRFGADWYQLWTPIQLNPLVHYKGDGMNATVIQLANGAGPGGAVNGDIFQGSPANINLGGAAGTGPGPGSGIPYLFSIEDMTVDGNFQQQGGNSFPIRFYGHGWLLRNLEIRNGFSGGLLCDYYGPSVGQSASAPADDSASQNWRGSGVLDHVICHNNTGSGHAIGVEIGGPTDSRMVNCEISDSGLHCLHVGPNETSLQVVNCHFWKPGVNTDPTSCTGLVEAIGFLAANSEFEGSNFGPNLALLAPRFSILGGAVYGAGNGGLAGLGIQIGQGAGDGSFTSQVLAQTQAVGQYVIHGTAIENIVNAKGAIYFANDLGGLIDVRLKAQSAANVQATGTRSGNGTLKIQSSGYTPSATYPQQVLVGTGEVAFGMGASVDPGTGGTIGTVGVTNVQISIPTANETGWILQPGAYQGQEFRLINLSAFTGTFAAVGTSNVFNGINVTLAANGGLRFLWGRDNLWHVC